MSSSASFTSTDLIAASSRTLVEGGFTRISDKFEKWDTPTSRLFEDQYSIVGVVVFETCAELLRAWSDMQGALVDVISRHVGAQESKSWDGYLVLLSPGLAPSESAAIEQVRYDTTRLRKLVATGTDLKAAADVERVLRPLLPLRQEQVEIGRESVLDLLPKLLKDRNIPEEVMQILVDAFRDQSSLLERLHQRSQK